MSGEAGAMLCVITVVLVSVLATGSSNPTDLFATVRALQEQVKQLSEQRAQDAKLLDSLQQALQKASITHQHFVELRSEVETLR